MRRWWAGTVGLVVAVGLVSATVAHIIMVQIPQRNELRALDARMDKISKSMKSSGAVTWEPRRYRSDTITQAWFVPNEVSVQFKGAEIKTSPSSDTHRIIEVTLRR